MKTWMKKARNFQKVKVYPHGVAYLLFDLLYKNLLYKNLYFKFTYSFNLFIVLNLHSRFTSFILSGKPYEVIFV